jgi:hypothetical protein
MQITADLQVNKFEGSPSMTNMIQSALDYVPQLDDDDDQKSLSMFTDGLIPSYFEEPIRKKIDYDLLDTIKLKIKTNQDFLVMNGQIDGIVDDEKETKPFVKKREFFVHSTNNYNYSTVSHCVYLENQHQLFFFIEIQWRKSLYE